MTDIELVVKIDENLYRKMQSKNYVVSKSNTCACAIKNGTPLPKGHGRLIDADALDIDNLNRAYDDNFELDFGRLYTTDVIDMIANAPTIIGADEE